MDKIKFLARVDDDPIAQDAFRSVVNIKANQYSDLRNRLDNALSKVAEEKEKQDQEEKVKREAGTLSEIEEGSGPQSSLYGVKTTQ